MKQEIQTIIFESIRGLNEDLCDERLENPGETTHLYGGKDGTLWYYNKLIEVFRERSTSNLVEELITVIRELEKISGGYNG